MGRVLTALGTLFALVLFAPAAQAGTAGAAQEECPAGTYAPFVPTQTSITVDAEFRVGDDVTFVVAVTANTDDTITGTLAVSVSTGGGAGQSVAAAVFNQTYQYQGTPISVDLGSLSAGAYSINAEFTPDDGCVYGASAAQANFAVVSTVAGETPDGTGLLPDTGGFSLWWLLLALLLLAAGGGTVAYARGRKA
jgi:LPXTG-motif cell wall-anchored protein